MAKIIFRLIETFSLKLKKYLNDRIIAKVNTKEFLETHIINF